MARTLIRKPDSSAFFEVVYTPRGLGVSTDASSARDIRIIEAQSPVTSEA